VPIDLQYRRKAVATLTNRIGVYLLCDLDEVPMYVGQTVDGVRKRVRRHLTSARSDIIANRQIHVREIAWVRAYPVDNRQEIPSLENAIFHYYDARQPLMNAKVPPKPIGSLIVSDPSQIVQVMSDEEIAEKRDPALRLPRQAEHYSQIVGHFLAVIQTRDPIQLEQIRHSFLD
jgi:hypothetical protein